MVKKKASCNVFKMSDILVKREDSVSSSQSSNGRAKGGFRPLLSRNAKSDIQSPVTLWLSDPSDLSFMHTLSLYQVY